MLVRSVLSSWTRPMHHPPSSMPPRSGSATTSGAQVYALIDRELVSVRTVNTTSKVVGISRGVLSSRAAARGQVQFMTVVGRMGGGGRG